MTKQKLLSYYGSILEVINWHNVHTTIKKQIFANKATNDSIDKMIAHGKIYKN